MQQLPLGSDRDEGVATRRRFETLLQMRGTELDEHGRRTLSNAQEQGESCAHNRSGNSWYGSSVRKMVRVLLISLVAMVLHRLRSRQYRGGI